MLLFWRHGYEGVSIALLTETIAIKAPSLYAAFGSKEGLYREAVKLYLEGLGDIGVSRLNEAPTARAGLEAVLSAAAEAFTREGYPRGCMIGTGNLRCAEENRIIADETAALRQRSQLAFRQRLERGRDEGDVPSSADLDALTDFYTSVVEGMSVLALDGADRSRLERVGQQAMRSWPEN